MSQKNQVNESQELSSESLLSPRPAQSDLCGRELDAAVAERVMGWKAGQIFKRNRYQEFKDDDGNVWYVGGIPDPIAYECDHPEEQAFAPSTEIAAAMEVLDKFPYPATVEIRRNRFFYNLQTNDGWSVQISTPVELGYAVCATLPEAICRAALAAVENTQRNSVDGLG